MIKKAALFGLLLGVVYIFFLWFVVATGIALQKLPYLPLLIYVTLITIPLYLGLLSIRKNVYNNSINYGQAFYSGIVISICGALFIFVVLYIFEEVGFLVPELLADAEAVTRLNLKAEGKTDIEITQHIKERLVPHVMAISSLEQVLLLSAFLTTIVALLVRNKDTFTENN